jgi:hypothetical protein
MVNLLCDLFHDYFHLYYYKFVCFSSMIIHLLFINPNYLFWSCNLSSWIMSKLKTIDSKEKKLSSKINSSLDFNDVTSNLKERLLKSSRVKAKKTSF